MNGDWFSESGRVDSLPIDDRGLHYGDGLFETIAVRSGRPRLWDLHIERLHFGCTRLAIPAPSEESLRNLLRTSMQEVGISRVGLAKIVVTRGSTPRGYRFSAAQLPRVLLGLFDKQDIPAAVRTRGVNIRLCSTRLAAQAALAGIKSLNRLEQVLARNEWQDDSITEGLMLNDEDQVVCGTMSNLFVVCDSLLRTPPVTTSGICGVMRRQILTIAAANGIPVAVEPLPVTDIGRCSEMFICNSQFGLLAVRQCDDVEFSVTGSVTATIMSLLAISGIEECAQ